MLGHVLDQDLLGRGGRFVLVTEAVEELVESGAVLPFEDGEAGSGESEFGVVEAGGGFSLGRLGSGGVLRVGAVDGGAGFAETRFIGVFDRLELGGHLVDEGRALSVHTAPLSRAGRAAFEIFDGK